MQWKLIPAMLGTAVVASATTAFFITSTNQPVQNNAVNQNEQLVAAITDLRTSVQLLQTKLELPAAVQTSRTLPAGEREVMPDSAPAEATKTPQMVMVDPTPRQNQTFEELKDLLDQPRYVESLSLDALTKSEDLTSLPKPLQMVIISKAIEKFNQGEVDRHTFLRKQ